MEAITVRMEQLQYLLEISKHRSMNMASEKIHITPQALSISIKNLEEELGFLVLERTNQGVKLTENGRQLVKMTELYFAGIDRLIAENHRPKLTLSQITEPMVIYATFGGVHTFLVKLVRHFYQHFPNLQMEVRPYAYYDLLEMMQKDEISYAFFDQYLIQNEYQLEMESNITFHLLFDYQMVAQVPKNFAIADCKGLSLKSIFKYPFIFSSLIDPEKEPLRKFLRRSDVFGNPEKIYYSLNPRMTEELLRAGIGVATQHVLPYQDPDKFRLENVSVVPIVDDVRLVFGYISKKRPVGVERILLDYIEENLYRLLVE